MYFLVTQKYIDVCMSNKFLPLIVQLEFIKMISHLYKLLILEILDKYKFEFKIYLKIYGIIEIIAFICGTIGNDTKLTPTLFIRIPNPSLNEAIKCTT